MSFSVKKFREPDAEFYPGYFWLLDTPMTAENMLAMLHDMSEHKARSICMHPSPKGWTKYTYAEPHYMTPEYLEIMEKVYVEADRHLSLPFPPYVAVGVVLTATLALSAASFYGFERPMNKLVKRFLSKK